MTDSEIIKIVANKNKLVLNREPARFTSGFVNHVYDLDKFVLKIEDGSEYYKGILKPQGAVLGKLINAGAKVPKVFDTGDLEGRFYVLMEKVPGTNLSYDWLKFNLVEKESFIEQIAQQMQIFHSIKFDTYAITILAKKRFKNLRDSVANFVNFKKIDKTKLKKEFVADVEFLESFFEKNMHILNEHNTAVLVHTDISLENVFYQSNKIAGIIDWDWACQAPKDYELWEISDAFYNPKRRVEDQLKPFYEGYQMTEEFGFLKKYYPAMFATPNLINRIRIFIMDDLIDRFVYYQNGKATESLLVETQRQIKDFYKEDWLSKCLNY
ncbi:MAG: phosphotransferase [Candidatus Doudnabacteria bacterium]|nr:phosphotransferase [Candidatus Doudnabacteria bacterium]